LIVTIFGLLFLGGSLSCSTSCLGLLNDFCWPSWSLAIASIKFWDLWATVFLQILFYMPPCMDLLSCWCRKHNFILFRHSRLWKEELQRKYNYEYLYAITYNKATTVTHTGSCSKLLAFTSGAHNLMINKSTMLDPIILLTNYFVT